MKCKWCGFEDAVIIDDLNGPAVGSGVQRSIAPKVLCFPCAERWKIAVGTWCGTGLQEWLEFRRMEVSKKDSSKT